ncbi:oxygenase MpaB family protein [Subtercola sp. Z020]|uniref:oxygenase MpaB family protein n=1 Tax=Subtercola sp. Z020 TaxID=2080582 RepID=UPI00130D9742|nr:oxygenase MpaB family protein [Subtercola sp. Z020]
MPAAAAGTAVSYNAFDPEAQLWVAATLYQTALLVYEKTFGELSPREAEEVYQRYGVLGSALQMPSTLWPADLAAFRQYWDSAVAALDVTDSARRVAHDLLHPRTAPLWLRAAMPLVRLVTTGLLDDNLRRAFVLPWSARSQRRFDLLFRVAAAIYPRLPLTLRRLPRDRYMGALRASLAAPPASHSHPH